jgi:hypothetical protein
MLSLSGRFAASQASGTLVVTDTRDNVDRVARYIETQNASFTAQVAIDVRRDRGLAQRRQPVRGGPQCRVSTTQRGHRQCELGIQVRSPSTLTDSAAGSVGYNITKPGSSLNGTSLATQALNSFGTVVSDVTDTIITTNRVPGRKQNVTDKAYLASTTPGSGSAAGTGTGVPGEPWHRVLRHEPGRGSHDRENAMCCFSSSTRAAS